MEYLIGAVVASALIFFFLIKRKTDDFNKSAKHSFAAWHSNYLSIEMPEKAGLARSLIIQTLHLAQQLGVISLAEKKELDTGTMKEDPIQLINEWLEVALPNVSKVIPDDVLQSAEARLVGVYMLVTLKGVNPEGDLKKFLHRR